MSSGRRFQQLIRGCRRCMMSKGQWLKPNTTVAEQLKSFKCRAVSVSLYVLDSRVLSE